MGRVQAQGVTLAPLRLALVFLILALSGVVAADAAAPPRTATIVYSSAGDGEDWEIYAFPAAGGAAAKTGFWEARATTRSTRAMMASTSRAAGPAATSCWPTRSIASGSTANECSEAE